MSSAGRVLRRAWSFPFWPSALVVLAVAIHSRPLVCLALTVSVLKFVEESPWARGRVKDFGESRVFRRRPWLRVAVGLPLVMASAFGILAISFGWSGP